MSEADTELGAEKKKLEYPKSAYYFLCCGILWSIANYGLYGGIVFYMQRVLGLSATSAATTKTIIDSINNFAPIIGAILADAYLGKVILTTIFLKCDTSTVNE